MTLKSRVAKLEATGSQGDSLLVFIRCFSHDCAEDEQGIGGAWSLATGYVERGGTETEAGFVERIRVAG